MTEFMSDNQQVIIAIREHFVETAINVAVLSTLVHRSSTSQKQR